MDRIFPREPSRIRSLFISDVHLGSPHAQAALLLQFLHQYQPDNLYLVGDFVDGWRLKKRWHWSESANLILREIVLAVQQGMHVRYAIGNHDEFLRDCPLIDGFQSSLPFEISDEFVHHTADGRKYIVVHGDRFDDYHQSSPLFSHISEATYDLLLRANRIWNRWSGKNETRPTLSASVKRRISSLSNYIVQFEQSLSDYATASMTEGVICGHTHVPKSEIINGVHYCNTGDWVENKTAFIEHHDGQMELIHFREDTGSTTYETARIESLEPVVATNRVASREVVEA